MKICKYGVTLSLLTQQDIKFVSEKFYPLDENPPEESSANLPGNVEGWVERIYNFREFYYIIEYKGVKLGIIADKVLNWQKLSSEVAVMVWDDSYADTIIPMLASLCLIETGFNYLGWQSYSTRLNHKYSKAIENALSLGFVPSENDGKNEDQLYLLTQDLFETKVNIIEEDVSTYIDADSGEGYLLLEAADYETGIAQKIENRITESGIYLRRKGKAGGRKYSKVG